jgi:1-acylglycerone phosphate reductase
VVIFHLWPSQPKASLDHKADNIRFGKKSLYADVERKVKERSDQHAAKTIAPGPFAKQVVDRVLSTKEPSYIGKGTNAFLGWLLNAIRPRKIFDSWLDRAAGLDDAGLVDKIYQRAQRATERDL